MPLFGHMPYVMGQGNKKLPSVTRNPICSCIATTVSFAKAC